MIGIIELTSAVFSLLFTFIFIYVLIPKMKTEKIYWKDYFKQVDIYQGRSWHHDLWDLLVK
jgi:hypothetical protein